MKAISAIRSSSIVGLAALLLWATAIPYAVRTYLGGDHRALLRLGSDYRHPAVLEDVARDGPAGYDGQFFATLAADPFLLRPGAAGMFDNPAYRVGRIGMPLVAWALGAGDDGRAILVYQLLCWALAALGTWVVARWLEDEGRSPWWAAPLAFSGGVVASIFSSLPDAAAATLAVVGLWLHERQRRGALPVLAFSVLVKETNLIAVVAAAVGDHRQGRRIRAFVSVAIPVAALVAWRIWVATRPGFDQGNAGLHAFGIPFAWVPAKLRGPLDLAEVAALVGVAASVAAAAALLPRASSWSPAEVGFAGYATLAVFLSADVYLPIWWNYTRVLAPLPFLAAVIAEREEAAWRRWLLRLVSLSWGVAGAAMNYRWAAGFAAVLAVAWWLRRGASPRGTPDQGPSRAA